nr:hypothetical protein [Gluconobacter sphaericus]
MIEEVNPVKKSRDAGNIGRINNATCDMKPRRGEITLSLSEFILLTAGNHNLSIKLGRLARHSPPQTRYPTNDDNFLLLKFMTDLLFLEIRGEIFYTLHALRDGLQRQNSRHARHGRLTRADHVLEHLGRHTAVRAFPIATSTVTTGASSIRSNAKSTPLRSIRIMERFTCRSCARSKSECRVSGRRTEKVSSLF